MRALKFISDVITEYEKDHKPLDLDTLMTLIHGAKWEVEFPYKGELAKLYHLSIFNNIVTLNILTNVDHNEIFPRNHKFILYLITTDKHDDLSNVVNCENTFTNNISFSKIGNNYFVWTDIENKKAAALFVEDNIVKYNLCFDGYRLSCYNESKKFIIEKFKKDIPDVVNNMLAWNLLNELKGTRD